MSRFNTSSEAATFKAPAAALPLSAVGPMSAPAERHGVLVNILGAYALMCTVPVAELLVTKVGVHIPIVVIAQIVLTFGLFSAGRITEFWKLPIAKPYMALLVLMGVAAVLGHYPTRSLELVLPYGFRFHVLPFYCCAIAVTTRQVRRVVSWVGWGAFLLLILCVFFGKVTEDRFVIPESSLSNPNDLGFAILFVMTGLIVLQSKIARVLVALSMPVFFMYLLKTGSRADMVTLIALLAVAFYFAPRGWKMLMLIALPVLAGIVLAVVPGQTLARLSLVVARSATAGTSNIELSQALDSSAARLELQQRAIQLAARHPFLGVGVTNFEDAVDEMVQNTLHHKSGWQVAHNTYLQMAAENGIAAFIVYIWSLIVCLKMNLWSYRTCRRTPHLSDAVTQSFALIMMTLMFMVCTAFSNNSCDPHMGVLIGLSAANYLAVRRESQTSLAGTGFAQPLWSPAPRVVPPRAGRLPIPVRGVGPA